MSVLIFHPSVAPFVQQAARALHEADQLDRFVTTLCDNPASTHQRVLSGLSRIAGRDLAAQFRRRAVTEIPAAKIETLPWGELLRLATGLTRSRRLTDLVWERTEHRFDREVAARLRSGLSGVYGFEHSSLATFRRARELGVRLVYDVPAPESGFATQLLQAELDRFPELRTAYNRHTAAREDRRIARRHAEWNHADLIIAASQFTRESFARAGLAVEKVRIIPYGAPPPVARDTALRPADATGRPLMLLWAGTFSLRKGAHHLLDAWRTGHLGRHARLRVFGSVGLPERALRPLPEGVELGGAIPRDELFKHYQQADALIFPTLCDGFGMVVTEAWSRGLPVITTDRAGAADLLRPNQNGLLINAGDPAAIIGAVKWCLAHRAELAAMRESALATAAAWQWADYRALHARTLHAAGIFGAAS